MKINGIILIILTCFSNLSLSQTDTTITQVEWTKDLIFLEQTINRKHKNVNHRISKDELRSKFSSLKDKFDSLDSKEKLIELIIIMSAIGDGHSNIRSYDIFNYLPIRVKWFGKDLHIIWAKSSLSDILGYKILSIDGQDISIVGELVNKLSPSGENKYLLMQWGQQWIRNIDVLYYLGISKSQTGIDLLLEDQTGFLVKKRISALLTEEQKEMKWESVFDPLPLYMQNANYSLKHEILGNVLYFNFRSYPSKREMNSHAKELLNILSERQELTKLIVDFRANGGGNFEIGRLLIDRLKDSNVLTNRKVYVITGRRTYSAAMVNALDFRKQLGAFILGEPPMQRPNGYSESYSFTLPNSKINASVSTEYYSFQNGDSDEVSLDIYFNPNFDLLKIGRDEIIEWIVEQ